MKAIPPKNILVVRTDRIGDVVLSLPMIPALTRSFPEAGVYFLLREYTRDLAGNIPGLRGILLYDTEKKKKAFLKMLGELRAWEFDTVIVTYPTFRLAVLMFLSRIPVRVGSGYRWYSVLFNRRVYEHRRTAEKHEAEYNFSLLQTIGCVDHSSPMPELVIPPAAEREAEIVLKEIGMNGSDRFVVLHPGSGGSARDWDPRNFAALGTTLRKEGIKVLVTGSAEEEGLVNEVNAAAGGVLTPLAGRLSLLGLAVVLRRADVFVGNSTGPLHVAAAVGTPVVGMYPPIRECSPRRWGPLTDKRVIFEPSAFDCPRCRGGACQGNECMALIRVDDVARAVKGLMQNHRKQKREPAAV
ncbi:MAG: glycosyltransferase family 9 protein [Bacteroidota bacterium]